jgi:hypothetical protein
MWISRPFWTDTENLAPSGVRTPIQQTYHTKFSLKQQMTDGLPVTVVIGPIVSEVKVITPYKFWGAVHEYDNYNCLSALLSNVWGGSQFVHFALLLALSDTEQHIWQPSYEGDNTIFPENCGALDDEHGENFHRDISAFTDVGVLLLKGNRRFSWTCVQTVGDKAAQLIKASQSVYTVSRIQCLRHF